MKIFKSKPFNLFILFLFLSTTIFIFSDNSNAVSPSPSNSYGLVNSTSGKFTRGNSFTSPKVISLCDYNTYLLIQNLSEEENEFNFTKSITIDNKTIKIFNYSAENKFKKILNKYNLSFKKYSHLKEKYINMKNNIFNQELLNYNSSYTILHLNSSFNNCNTRSVENYYPFPSNTSILWFYSDSDFFNYIIQTDIPFSGNFNINLVIGETLSNSLNDFRGYTPSFKYFSYEGYLYLYSEIYSGFYNTNTGFTLKSGYYYYFYITLNVHNSNSQYITDIPFNTFFSAEFSQNDIFKLNFIKSNYYYQNDNVYIQNSLGITASDNYFGVQMNNPVITSDNTISQFTEFISIKTYHDGQHENEIAWNILRFGVNKYGVIFGYKTSYIGNDYYQLTFYYLNYVEGDNMLSVDELMPIDTISLSKNTFFSFKFRLNFVFNYYVGTGTNYNELSGIYLTIYYGSGNDTSNILANINYNGKIYKFDSPQANPLNNIGIFQNMYGYNQLHLMTMGLLNVNEFKKENVYVNLFLPSDNNISYYNAGKFSYYFQKIGIDIFDIGIKYIFVSGYRITSIPLPINYLNVKISADNYSRVINLKSYNGFTVTLFLYKYISFLNETVITISPFNFSAPDNSTINLDDTFINLGELKAINNETYINGFFLSSSYILNRIIILNFHPLYPFYQFIIKSQTLYAEKVNHVNILINEYVKHFAIYQKIGDNFILYSQYNITKYNILYNKNYTYFPNNVIINLTFSKMGNYRFLVISIVSDNITYPNTLPPDYLYSLDDKKIGYIIVEYPNTYSGGKPDILTTNLFGISFANILFIIYFISLLGIAIFMIFKQSFSAVGFLGIAVIGMIPLIIFGIIEMWIIFLIIIIASLGIAYKFSGISGGGS